MTKKEWIKENFVKPDIDYLKKCGFEIVIKKNDCMIFNNEYKVIVGDGEDFCIFSSPYQLEQAVNMIKMYLVLKKNDTRRNSKD